MKKTKKPSRNRKLSVPRETIALLTPPQLADVAGGGCDSFFSSCHSGNDPIEIEKN